jgi:hypothetical protein
MVHQCGLRALQIETAKSSIRNCTLRYQNLNTRVIKYLRYRFFKKGKLFFHGLLFCIFMDFTIYVIGIDQPWVAFLARNHNKLTFHNFYIILADNSAIHLETSELFNYK